MSALKLASPYFADISLYLVENMVSTPSIMTEAMDLFELARRDFFANNLEHILPTLVRKGNRVALQQVANTLRPLPNGEASPPGALIVDSAAKVMAPIFLQPLQEDVDIGITNMMALLDGKIDFIRFAKTCEVSTLGMLVVELGDSDEARRNQVRMKH